MPKSLQFLISYGDTPEEITNNVMDYSNLAYGGLTPCQIEQIHDYLTTHTNIWFGDNLTITAPPSISNLAVTCNEANHSVISWEGAANSGYIICYSTDFNTPPICDTLLLPPNENGVIITPDLTNAYTNYEFRNLQPNTDYLFTVTAFNTNCQGTDTLFSDSGSINLLTTPNIQHIIEGSPLWINPLDSTQQAIICIEVNPLTGDTLSINPAILQVNDTIYDSTQHVVRWWVNDFLPQDTTLIDDQPLVTTQPGTYTLLLTNTSEQCSACTTFEVTTHEIGVNLFTVEGFICWGNTLTFTNYTLPAIPIESITWYRNGNLLAGETNDTLLLTAPKISIGDNAYVVVVNYTNGCQASDTITGEVKSISTTYQHDHHCTQELPLLLVNDSVDLWYKDGLAIPGAVNDSLWVTEAGEYVAYNALETLETSCKSKSAGYFIYLYDSPVINLGADTALCQNQAPLTLDVGTPPTTLNLYPDGVQTVWNTPDGFTIGQTCTANTTGQYIATTTYTYIYDIDQTHTCTTTDTIQVTINPLPTATISPTPDANGFLCGEYLTELTASGGVAYQWSTGVTTQSILAYFLPYQYTVTVTDANGCQNSTSVIVGYRALADLGADIAVCQDQVPITLSTPTPPTTNTDELEVAYLWNTGATTPAISVTQSGTYNVTVTYTNKFGEQTYTCTATDTIQVTVNPLPTPSIANDNLYDCQTTAATLCVQPQSYDNYYWSTNETSPCITIDQPGTYTLTATTPEGCQNNATYTATDFDLTGYQFTADVVIATNTTWNAASFAQGIMRTKGNIIVQPGVTLTIDNLTLHFADQKGIIVQQGVVNDVPLAGKLLITNSHLTNDICQPTQPWQGIQLHADQTQAQNTPALIDAYHAHLSTQNTTIENAMMGVAAGKTVITQIAPNLQQIEEFGGGIAAIHSTTFKNCAVGVKLHPYQFAAATTIKNSQFMITDPFIASYNNPANSYIGVWLKSINGVAITATTFNNTNPTVFDIEKQGIGVLAVNADLRLGQYYSPIDGANLSCTFTNLSKGIDAYGSANVYNALQIWHNTFTQTRRGITLNGNAYCTAIGNTFTVPQSNSTNNNTYAYWLQNANGCLIANDSIATDNIDIGNHFTFGIVANEIENGSDILDNTFTGVFEAANLFIGQNDNLNITCNSYKDLNIADWRLLDLEDIQNNNVIHTGRLNEQGVCIFDEMLNEPNHNQWHSPTNEMPKAHWHINNASTDPNFSVVVKWDENCPGCEPTDLNGAVNADYYCKSSDDICPPLYNSANGNGGGIGIGSDIGIAAINDTIRQYIAQNNYTNALQWQTVMPNTWYYLSTATSYLQQGNFGQAQNAMNNISNTQLQKWYQLNYELLQDTLDEDAVLDSLTILANYQKGTLASTLAESVLAEHENTLQLRNVGMYNNGKTKNSTIVANNNGLLQIHPNPAKNKVTISYHTPVDDASLVISDITGKIASVIVFESEQITIDTQHLPSGIYIVTLQQNHTALAMVKLVVTK
ncbi:MAG: T9SS type A sorting domain-containing protein [Sphingobacteriales bacterium]|nr:T9SS type A sorting domain-containing protein [Sphingobacteriales bacterium]